MITVESEHVHEVVRVVRVRHIVTHVSSIGQFFHRRSSYRRGVSGPRFSRGPTVRARVVPAARRRGSLRRAPGPPGYITPRRRQAAAASPRAAKADLHLRPRGGATTGVHVSFGFAENQPPPFDRIPI